MSEQDKAVGCRHGSVDELKRVIAAKDQELAALYALVNHYKCRVDDLARTLLSLFILNSNGAQSSTDGSLHKLAAADGLNEVAATETEGTIPLGSCKSPSCRGVL